MAQTGTPDARAERLLGILKPYILQLLRDAPDHGEISIAAVLHDGDIGRVRLGSDMSLVVAPRKNRGQA